MEIHKVQNSNLRRNGIDLIGVLLGLFALIAQFVLMMQNRQTDVFEAIIRFFSFFTILTKSTGCPLFQLPNSYFQ